LDERAMLELGDFHEGQRVLVGEVLGGQASSPDKLPA
jgi:hypothetical protein